MKKFGVGQSNQCQSLGYVEGKAYRIRQTRSMSIVLPGPVGLQALDNNLLTPHAVGVAIMAAGQGQCTKAISNSHDRNCRHVMVSSQAVSVNGKLRAKDPLLSMALQWRPGSSLDTSP